MRSDGDPVPLRGAEKLRPSDFVSIHSCLRQEHFIEERKLACQERKYEIAGKDLLGFKEQACALRNLLRVRVPALFREVFRLQCYPSKIFIEHVVVQASPTRSDVLELRERKSVGVIPPMRNQHPRISFG